MTNRKLFSPGLFQLRVPDQTIVTHKTLLFHGFRALLHVLEVFNKKFMNNKQLDLKNSLGYPLA